MISWRTVLALLLLAVAAAASLLAWSNQAANQLWVARSAAQEQQIVALSEANRTFASQNLELRVDIATSDERYEQLRERFVAIGQDLDASQRDVLTLEDRVAVLANDTAGAQDYRALLDRELRDALRRIDAYVLALSAMEFCASQHARLSDQLMNGDDQQGVIEGLIDRTNESCADAERRADALT